MLLSEKKKKLNKHAFNWQVQNSKQGGLFIQQVNGNDKIFTEKKKKKTTKKKRHKKLRKDLKQMFSF